ncbi:MAG: L,D-transpeptidase/peptidoglycan binding protein [Clostridia bacterium]|nr:L,D-transpeptidase/peptidoglycan binding protein [Clostridia bacterium]
MKMLLIDIKRLLKSKAASNTLIVFACFLLAYILVSFYFINHAFFRTYLNGADISLMSMEKAEKAIRLYVKDYKVDLIERNGEIETIVAQEIELKINEECDIRSIFFAQNPIIWINSLFWEQKYFICDLYVFNNALLEKKVNELNCLNKDFIEPKNVSFRFMNGSYETIKEIYGNKVNREKLKKALEMSIKEGRTRLDLNENDCYENPKYTLSSEKTPKTKKQLEKCVSSRTTYVFGEEKEILDAGIINQWLSVDENLDVVINANSVKEYVRALSKKYDTVGMARKIRTSSYRTIEVKGGFYGWRINREAEAKAIAKSVMHGEVTEREPVYSQRAATRGKNDIGNTYVEISLTRQHLWFYKGGRLVAQGPVVSGNPSKGHATPTGVYFINYKEKDSILNGQDYESEVRYWMPFNGNIGIHDASWRHSFGGSIYKSNGSHGCINSPLYLAKKIFDNIEEGTPVICYEE